MTEVLAPPATAGEHPASSRRRPGRFGGGGSLALAGLLAVVGVAASAVLLWPPATVDLAAGPTSFGGTVTVVTLPGYGERGTHVVEYRHGADVTVTVPVRNAGRLPVSVTSAAIGGGDLPLLEVREVTGLPLSLGPGEEGRLVLHAVLTNCAYYHLREVQNVRELVLDVDVRLGPLTRSVTAALTLDRPLLVRSPMIVGCPDRKRDRQADDRRNAL